MSRSKLSSSLGFTIVELLIVVVVIAILAAISMVAYTNIQQRARLANLQSAATQMQKSLDIAKVESDNYPNAINSCPTPVSGSVCLAIPSGYTATYQRIQPGTSASPVTAGTISEQAYALTLNSGTSIKYISNAERTGTNEFLQYMDMAPIIDQYGLVSYQINFDIKSANTSTANIIRIYMQNGSGSKYGFEIPMTVTTSYERKSLTVTPTLANASLANSVLAFYGTYSTGNIPSVKNLEIIRVN